MNITTSYNKIYTPRGKKLKTNSDYKKILIDVKTLCESNLNHSREFKPEIHDFTKKKLK